MQKLRSCLETAARYIKKKQSQSIAREVTLLHHQEDEYGEEETVEQQSGPLVVRSISGKVLHSQDKHGVGTRVMDIVSSVCQNTEARTDEVYLMAGENILEHTAILGPGCVASGPGEALELSAAVVAGPPVTVESLTGSRIALEGVPEVGEDCHVDRDYVFSSLGDFAQTGMRFLMTSNNDRKTPAHQVMWQLDIREPAVVFINFRSERHVQKGHAPKWLNRDGWKLQSGFKSAVSSGYPNGPYAGPVYAKTIRPQNRKYLVDLMGSDYWEGTYFVFVQMEGVAL